MAFDLNEARATIEEAKKRGLIRNPGSPDNISPEPLPKPKSKEQPTGVVLPDWLLGTEAMPRPSKRRPGN